MRMYSVLGLLILISYHRATDFSQVVWHRGLLSHLLSKYPQSRRLIYPSVRLISSRRACGLILPQGRVFQVRRVVIHA